MAADNEAVPSGSGHHHVQGGQGSGSASTTGTSPGEGSGSVSPPGHHCINQSSAKDSSSSSLSLIWFKRGDKKSTARSLLKDVTKYNDVRGLNEILFDLLDPRKDFSSPETISWINHLIAGGRSPDEFSSLVKSFDRATSCGLVWTANFVAYRCRTCGISPCMSLCAECFQKGNHEGHDYNMFRSQAGGACDCGDASVMKQSGFCSAHQPQTTTNQDAKNDLDTCPSDLLVITSLILPRLLDRLLICLRQNDQLIAIRESDEFISQVLIFLTEMGDSMRHIVMRSLISPTDYSSMMTLMSGHDDLERREIINQRFENYKKAKKSLSTFQPGSDWFHNQCSLCPVGQLKDIKSFSPDLKHESFVDELLFWTIIYEFPSKLVCFLLNMLPEYEYKCRFAASFVHHYSRISTMLAKFRNGSNENPDHSPSSSGRNSTTAHDQLSNCVVHVSVQLFSNEPLAEKLCRQDHLLHVMISSLKATIEGSSRSSSCDLESSSLPGILIKSSISSVKSSKFESSNLSSRTIIANNVHKVVRCDDYIMRKHTYWPLVSDLNNILTHSPVSLLMMSDSHLVSSWMSFMSNFQAMNLNVRELVEHIEYENESYYAAFSAELEICSTPIWTLVGHLKNSNSSNLSRNMINAAMAALDNWFSLIGFTSDCVPNPLQATFHLPLHRYLAIFVHHGVKYQNLDIDTLLPTQSESKLIQLVSHPLQVLVSFYEILCGLWTRNGLQMKGQAMTYIQCHFCNSMIDPDIFLIQCVAANLNSDTFIESVFNRFHVLEWFSFSKNSSQSSSGNVQGSSSSSTNTSSSDTLRSFLEPDQFIPMVEAALTFLVTILTVRTNLGSSESSITRKEMVTLLSMSDRTHSQLLDLLPEKCGTSGQNSNSGSSNCVLQAASVESILEDIAVFKKPTLESGGNLSQGMFTPKSSIWTSEFDPVHVLLRAVHRRDYQSSMDRFTSFVKSSCHHRSSGGQVGGHLWPPFRIPESPGSGFRDPSRVLTHSKTLHGLLFSLLFKAVHVTDSITDQVLALTIHVLELCLHNCSTNNEQSSGSSNVLPLAEATKSAFCVQDLKFSDWFNCDSMINNMNHLIQSVTFEEPKSSSGPLVLPSPSSGSMIGPSVEEMEVDLQDLDSDSESESDHNNQHNEEDQFMSTAEDDLLLDQSSSRTIEAPPTIEQLPSINVPLALLPPPPSSSSLIGSQLSPSALALIPSQREIALMNANAASSSSANVSIVNQRSTSLGVPALIAGPSTSPVLSSAMAMSSALGQSPPPRVWNSLAIGSSGTSASLAIPGSSSSSSSRTSFQPMARSAPTSSPPRSSMRALPSCSSSTSLTHGSQLVNESILSLLLQLHSKLSKKPDSYKVSNLDISSSEDSRIGDGPFFVAKLIDKYVKLSPVSGIKAVNEWRQRLWPASITRSHSSLGSTSSSSRTVQDQDQEESSALSPAEIKKQKAKERQARLMAEFASKQAAFLAKQDDVTMMTSGCQDDTMTTTDDTSCQDDVNMSSCHLEGSKKQDKLRYECVICNQTTTSSLDKMVGMVTLLQSTSVIGHAVPFDATGHPVKSYVNPDLSLNDIDTWNTLPIKDPEAERSLRQVHSSSNLSRVMSSRIEQLDKYFNASSWMSAVSIGWQGGIHVATCGHFLHLDCHKSYMTSLRSSGSGSAMNRQGLDSGEFSCPLCRQLANSVLPLVPELDSRTIVSRQPNVSSSVASRDQEIYCLIENAASSIQNQSSNPEPSSSSSDPEHVSSSSSSSSDHRVLIKLLGPFMEDVTKATSPQHRSLQVHPTTESLFLFLCSIIRTNLESGILNSILSCSSSRTCPSTNNCFKSLFHVLSLNAKVFVSLPVTLTTWRFLAGIESSPGLTPVASGGPDVPLVLKDPISLLIHFLVVLPPKLEHVIFDHVVHRLFHLAVIQSMVTVSCLIGHESRSRVVTKDHESSFWSLLKSLIQQLDSSSSSCSSSFFINLLEDSKSRPSSSPGGWKNQDEISSSILISLLPFLRSASLLKIHLLDESPPVNQHDDSFSSLNSREEFSHWSSFLGLRRGEEERRGEEGIKKSADEILSQSISSCCSSSSPSLSNLWIQELIHFASKSNSFLAQQLVISRPLGFHPPSLIRLPATYDQLFLSFHTSRCSQCSRIPKESSLCLVCGTIVCMRESCCKTNIPNSNSSSSSTSSSMTSTCLEAVSHAITCGSSTCIYLAINSSTIIVIRGKRACVWGSLYLDSYGEEDRDLKRGKPLFLSHARFAILESQWRSHCFDHTNKRWVWHKDTL